MPSRRARAIFLCLGAAAALAACAAPRPRPARRAPAPVRATAVDRAHLDQLFARAVFAYRKGSYRDAEWYLHDILRLDPGHRDALALRSRLKAIDKLSDK